MSNKERLSRRSAIFALAGATAAGVGLAIKEKVSPYIRYLASRNFEDASLEEEGIEQFIGVRGEVGVNKSVFAEALEFIARKENPEKGVSWLYAFLKEFPLEIQFPQEEAPPLISKDGKVYQAMAGYVPALDRNGPTFKFYPFFLQEYHRAKRELDIGAQKENDALVWHEIVHYWQDMRGPIKQTVTTGVHQSLERVNHNRIIQFYDIVADPFEVEAWKKAGEIVEARYNYVVETGDYKNWPFGHFFI